MKKIFIEPKVRIAEIELKDVIATSTGATVPDAPFKSRDSILDEDFE